MSSGAAPPGPAVTSVDVVVPTIGRPSLAELLDALAPQLSDLPGRVILVNDRPDVALALPLDADVSVVPGRGTGPAAARNVGWRSSAAEWIAFLDDDVLPPDDWVDQLLADLRATAATTGAVQGRIRVPLPRDRRPTDWERNVRGLETARWATADMAYRRQALAAVGGFDERFPRAYREDADLALRVEEAGWRLARGRREVLHPVRPAGPGVSVRLQAGNADDALMRAVHGRGWRERAGVPRGRRRRHLAITAAGVVGVVAAVAGRRRVASIAGGAWLAGTAELAWKRIAPGPRDPREIVTMVGTSVALPVAASAWTVRGWFVAVALRRAGPRQPGAPGAVLFDRDGTLVSDVPYNGDPDQVVPMPGAQVALDRLRAAGVRTAVISNQSGVGRGLLGPDAVHAVNRRVEELLGPLGPWFVCLHAPDDGCGCRKPAPGLVLAAAAELGVDPRDCVVVGDIGSDVDAARSAGARAVLVPTPRTRPEEVAAAPDVAPDLETAVARILGGAS